MKTYTLKEIGNIVDGKLFCNNEDYEITRVVIDSRLHFAPRNVLFFALTGPRNNGHNFIDQLIKKGVTAFVVSNPESVNKQANFILVDDTTRALQQLAAFHRQQFRYPVMGITGSNGKTIVKEWLHMLLGNHFQIVKSPKSYNSQIGVPLSVLLMDDNYNLAIFEAGISKPNEMPNLQEIIAPDVGIITNIGDAHQENFKSLKEKTHEKLQLFLSAKYLIYCEDQENSGEYSQFCKTHSIKKINWSAKGNRAAIAISTKKTEYATAITAKTPKKEYRFTIPFTDNSSIENSCHCFAALFALTSQPEEITPLFEQLETVEMRLEIKQGINNCLLVNDYYNSDLQSLFIALAVLKQQAAQAHLHKIVILSDIQQTGLAPDILYRQINKMLEEWEMDEIIGIGSKILEHQGLFSIKKRFFPSRKAFENHFQRTDFNNAAILIKGARQFEFEKISALLQQKAHQTRLEISLNKLVENLNIFKNLLHPETKIMVMVKAFSYGSGDVEIAKVLQYQNVDYLAVAVTDEGVQLRNSGITTPIVVMNPEPGSFQQLFEYNLEPNIYSIELLERLLNAAKNIGVNRFPIHLKIDTGMNRLGLKTDREITAAAKIIAGNTHVHLSSVFSHLAATDDSQMDNFTNAQVERFKYCSQLIEDFVPYRFYKHILNSAGTERFTEFQFDMIRLGIGLYGVSLTGLPVQPIGSLKSMVSQVKKVKPEETVGYNRKGNIYSESEIAIIPLGYADGLDRKLGNKNGFVWIKNTRAPIIGNICMDMLMVDVTGLNVQTGDEVEFFGQHISLIELAKRAGTIPYEILTGISQRVKRVYLQE